MAEANFVNMKKNINTNKTRTEFNLFDDKDKKIHVYMKGVKVLSEGMERKSLEEDNSLKKGKQNDIDISKSNGKSCILCSVTFLTVEEQRCHFKLDWHKYNIKQRLLSREPVNEDVFEEIISGELSSISGSDTESDSVEDFETTANPENIPLMTLSLLPDEQKIRTEVDEINKSNPRVYFVNETGIHMSVFREVVYGTKEILTGEEIEARIENLQNEKFWLILMTGGGHFAGAVFSGNDVVVSKTFHRYTVRAKRGTSQGIRDNKQGGHAPRSAGASLRRYNEAALVQDIQNLLELWNEHIEKCCRIFMRVPNNYKWIFFAGKKPPFEKDDSRIRVIPFATRRATFKELENVRKKLSTVVVEENYLERIKENQARQVNNENVTGQNKGQILEDDTMKTRVEKVKGTDDEMQCEKENLNSLVKKKAKKEKISRKENQNKKESKKTSDVEERKKEVTLVPEMWIELYETISSGNVEKTKDIIQKITLCNSLKQEYNINPCQESVEENRDHNADDLKVEDAHVVNNKDEIKYGDELNNDNKDLINQRFENYSNETMLHLASRLGHADIVKILLESGGNPTVKNGNGRVSYNVAKDKETRNVFRRFMAIYPDRYDYNDAQIPSALTREMEEKGREKALEKKKAQSKARKQRIKEKKTEEKQKEEEKLRKEKEENEKKWFQNLSDREKRAVAAERRFGNICFNCGRSLQGMVPFERLSNKYCSTECVQKHRQIMQSAVK